MQGRFRCADAGQQSIYYTTRRDESLKPGAYSGERVLSTQRARCDADLVAEAPLNNRNSKQVSEAHLDLSLKSKNQLMNVARNNVAPIPHKPRLIPGEERIERRINRKCARIKATWQRTGHPSIQRSFTPTRIVYHLIDATTRPRTSDV